MSTNSLRLSLLAGAALALSIAGVSLAQTAAAPAAPSAKVERRVVVMTDGGPPQVMNMSGDSDEQVTVGPNGERRVIIVRHGGGDMDEMGPPGMPGMPGMHGGHHHDMDPAAHAQHLRDILQLRPDQEPALQAFLTSMQPPEKLPEHMDPEAMEKMTTPERLDWMSARMSEHQAMFQAHADAIKKFYSALNPAQRKAFEAAHAGHGGRGGEGGEGRMVMRFRHEGHGPMPPHAPEPPTPPAK